MSLTGRGWALATASVLLVVAGALFGIEECYALAVAAVVVLVGAAGWVRWRPWGVHSIRQVRPARVPAGAPALAELALDNRADRRSPLLAVRDRFDGGRRWAAFAVAPLAAGATLVSSYPLPTTERGVFEVGPLRMELSDPFGLVSRWRPGAEASTLTVHPRIVALTPRRSPTGSDHRPPDAAASIGHDGSELYAVREYRTGDDLRRVHWTSTARLGELMIRQDESPQRGRLSVVVDTRPEGWTAERFETALSTAASIAEAALGDGLFVRLETTAGVDTGFGASPAHRAFILDHLAAASLEGSQRAPRAFSPAPGEAVVVVTAAGPDRWSVLGARGGNHTPVTVVQITTTTTTAAVSTTGAAPVRLVVLAGGIDDLPAAWAAQSRTRSGTVR